MVCVSGHGCSLVSMDKNGNLLRPAISCLDNRSVDCTEKIRQKAEKLVFEHNGNAVGTFNFEPKLLWMKENEPVHYAAMYKMISPTSYINYMLTGEWKANVSDFGIALGYDRRAGNQWNHDVIHAMGLDSNKYPDLYESSVIIGSIHKTAASQTGLLLGTPVLAGGEDTSSAALSLGVNQPGMTYLSMGTQCTVGVCTDKYAILPQLMCFPHVLSCLQLINGSMSTCGAGISWF